MAAKNNNKTTILIILGVVVVAGYFYITGRKDENYQNGSMGKYGDAANAMINLAKSAADTTSQLFDDINKTVSNAKEEKRKDWQQVSDTNQRWRESSSLISNII